MVRSMISQIDGVVAPAGYSRACVRALLYRRIGTKGLSLLFDQVSFKDRERLVYISSSKSNLIEYLFRM